MGQPRQIIPKGDRRWLQETDTLWRYVPLRTLFFYLDGQVFLPSLAKLRAEDPFECEFYEDIIWYNSGFDRRYRREAGSIHQWIDEKLCSDHERQFIEIQKTLPDAAAHVYREHYFDFIRRTRFAWCFFNSCLESVSMWNVYAKQCVAVQTTVGRLLKTLQNTKREFIYGSMTYVDYQNGPSGDFVPQGDVDSELIMRPFLLKRKEYESEHEVRFVTTAAERKRRGGLLLTGIDPTSWISSVRFWPGISPEEENALRRVVHTVMPKLDCAKSELFTATAERSIWFRDLLTAEENRADETWDSGQDGIPPLLKEV
jgi:hypothetical protein